MDSATGKIYSGDQAKTLPREVQGRLVPFEVGEEVVLKGCRFRVNYIRTDRSSMTLVGIPQTEERK